MDKKLNTLNNDSVNTHHYKEFIIVTGAREHNLKNINVKIPRNELVVITGLSGSGKSSLAFDTIYAEGQRRYVESLSAYARQFLEVMQKPDVDQIDGLSPAISIEQKTTSKNPRSTVGTVTEIYDYMRLLFARIGIPYSPATGLPIESQTVTQMVDRLMKLETGTRLYILAPIVRSRKGEYRKEILELQKQGFQRIKIDGEFYDIEDTPKLNKKVKHDIEVVVDRIAINEELGNRLADSIETSLQLADGLMIAELADEIDAETKQNKQIIFSERFSCPVSGFTIDEIEPRLFSFNNPHGACPKCNGLGVSREIDAKLIIPNETLSIEEGAISPWSSTKDGYFMQTINSVIKYYGGDIKTPWLLLDDEVKEAVLYGTKRTKIPISYIHDNSTYTTEKKFEGVINNMNRRWRETSSDWMRDEIGKYHSLKDCETCSGFRLKPEALAVKIANLHIGEVGLFSIKQAFSWFSDLKNHLNETHNKIGEPILKEIEERLRFLTNVGLEYLSLSRNSGTLSGGESQRIRLASQIGSGLTGVLYVLDEPSIGLHQRDNNRLLETLIRLRNLGNTVIVVEHDEDAIKTADYIVDMGPLAGQYGGEVSAKGTADDIIKNPKSLTGDYLSGRKFIELPKKPRKIDKKRNITISGARSNNLKSVKAQIYLGTFTCITGVSGSGKSTLIIDTLYAEIARKLNRSRIKSGFFDKIEGLENIDKIIDINQSPIGRTPRSNPATYTGAFTPIREWFTNLPEAKARGYKPGRFSFNVKGGRCEACQGDGVKKIEMHFLSDIYITCDECKGKRYNRETLEVKYKSKSIADVLDMTVEEAFEFFEAVPNIKSKMETLKKVGLGYIHVGQQATTLSGGEAQRIKLSKELSKQSTGRTLYILDEPTTGLHFHDVAKLLEVLHKLVDSGNTVIVIEHNLEVIKTADWIIDLGPDGGDGGGEIIIAGRPKDVAKHPKSYTGQYLKPLLEKKY